MELKRRRLFEVTNENNRLSLTPSHEARIPPGRYTAEEIAAFVTWQLALYVQPMRALDEATIIEPPQPPQGYTLPDGSTYPPRA